MFDAMRKPFFVLALALLLVALLLEAGSSLVVGSAAAQVDPAFADQADGRGVQALALLDALLMLTVGLIGLNLLLPDAVHGRVQGIVMLVVSLLVLLGTIVAIIGGLTQLGVMLGLLLAPPFGTAAYMAIWGDFDRSGAAAILTLLLLLKAGAAACLVLAQQRFLLNRSLVAMVVFSVVAGLLVGFLHGLVPGVLVSITDMVGAIVVAVIALVWSIVYLLGSVRSVWRALG